MLLMAIISRNPKLVSNSEPQGLCEVGICDATRITMGKKKVYWRGCCSFCAWDLVARNEELVSIVAGLYPRLVAGVEHE